jgi:hypothetical protein
MSLSKIQYSETFIYCSQLHCSISVVPELILFYIGNLRQFLSGPPVKSMNQDSTVSRQQEDGTDLDLCQVAGFGTNG